MGQHMRRLQILPFSPCPVVAILPRQSVLWGLCWSSSDLGNWIEWLSVCFQYLSPALVKKLHMKEHDLLLDGVREMFRNFYKVLTQKKQIPTVTNVHRLILESPGTAQQSAMEFFFKRGTITSIVLACFGQAIKFKHVPGRWRIWDVWLGAAQSTKV